jgi:energy-coupling factor transporter ATP-binding protein EcfA2
VTVVAEAAFQDRLWRPNLEPLADIARIRVIRCTAPAAVAHDRIAQRVAQDAHRAAHGDRELLEAIAAGKHMLESFAPISLDVPTRTVDTSGGCTPSIEDIAASMGIASNMFLGRELRRPGILGSAFRMLDKKRMRQEAAEHMADLKIGLRSLTQAVATLSGGQRQAVAVARAVAWARSVVVMDEPTAALGVKESGQVLDLIRRVRDKGMPVVLISHNMPHVFEIADRIHVHRLGRRAALIKPSDYSMAEVVAIMTGALTVDEAGSTVVADSEAAKAVGVRPTDPYDSVPDGFRPRPRPEPASRTGDGFPMAANRRPTLADVAQEVGVSAKTVSRVLNEDGPVSARTREQVLAAVAKLDFQPNLMARNIRVGGPDTTIGLVVPDLGNPFFGAVAGSIEDTVRDRRLILLMAPPPATPAANAP